MELAPKSHKTDKTCDAILLWNSIVIVNNHPEVGDPASCCIAQRGYNLTKCCIIIIEDTMAYIMQSHKS